MSMKKLISVEKIVVHGAFTPPEMGIGVDEIRLWHLDAGFDDAGYHLVIRRSGEWEFGRSLHYQGAHAPPDNDKSIGICLIGGRRTNIEGLEPDEQWEANYNGAQYASLQKACHWFRIRWPDVPVVGHSDVTPGRKCPGFDVASWWRYAAGRST